MARKKRKLKRGAILPLCIIAFFLIYFGSFWWFSSIQKSGNVEVQTQSKEDNRPLLTQLRYKEKIYLSDNNVKNIRIESDYWHELDYILSELREVRTPESFNPVYTGYSDDGIKFSTDLNYLRVYTVSKESYYKIPVDSQQEFSNVLNKSIYTSFGFINQYKNWDSVSITYKNKTKKIHKWKFDELSYKMASKRIVGKVQPEKSKERSEYNFTIDIKGENYEVTIETMSKDYVKITSGDLQAYYEVYTGLFEYIKDNVFKIGVE